MGHSWNCSRNRGQLCDCGFTFPLADWERELLSRPADKPVKDQILDRIREVEQELNEYFRLIGKCLIAGTNAELATHSAHQCEARIDELKNVLKMLEG